MGRLLTPEEVTKFKTVLADYKLHQAGMQQFQDSNFAVIAGPAGAGKDTLRNELLARYPELYLPILSTTTRPMREGEQDDVTYHFKEVEEVYSGLLARDFFQADLVHNQQVSCLHISEIEKLSPDQTGLSILITATEHKLRAVKPDIKTIFIVPPDLDTLVARMQAQRTLSSEEVGRRLAAAKLEITHALNAANYICLVSDTISELTGKAHKFLQTGNATSDAAARTVMQQIVDGLSS